MKLEIAKRKDYNFTVVLVSKCGVYMVDFGKFYGNYNVLNSVLDNLTRDNLKDMAKVYLLKNNKVMFREIEPKSPQSQVYSILASEVIERFKTDTELFGTDMETALNNAISSKQPYLRMGITCVVEKQVVSSFVIEDSEPINMSSLIHKVYDVRRKKVRS